MPAVYVEKDGPIAQLVLNSPETRNALSLEVIRSVMDHLDAIGRDPDLRVVILRGEGPAFCAGHNLKDMVAEGADIHMYRELFSTCSRMMLRIHTLPSL